MKKNKIAWIASGLVLTMMLSFGWMACNDAPNDEKEVTINLNIAQPADQDANTSATLPPDPTYTYHVRVVLTNPSEAHVIKNVDLDGPVSVRVSNGTNRELYVEVYQVENDEMNLYPNYFPAELLKMCGGEPILLNFQGGALAQEVSVCYGTSTGYLYADDDSFKASVLGGVTSIPKNEYGDYDANGQYPYDDFTATITDTVWGVTFPTIAAYLWDSGEMEMAGVGDEPILQQVPLGQHLKIKVEHYDLPLTATSNFMADDTARLVFQLGNVSTGTIQFGATAFDGWYEYEYYSAYYDSPSISGGLNNCGNYELINPSIVAGSDTCNGEAYRNYYFASGTPSGSSCVVHMKALDCGLIPVEFKKTVELQPGE